MQKFYLFIILLEHNLDFKICSIENLFFAYYLFPKCHIVKLAR